MLRIGQDRGDCLLEQSTPLTKLLLSGVAYVASMALLFVAGGASGSPETGARTVNHSPFFHKTRDVRLLYNQNSNTDNKGVDSQNFTSALTSAAAYDDAGADDFVVPKGQTWIVTEVDASGFYFNGSGPATSENVLFYRNSKNQPGKTVKGGQFEDIHCLDIEFGNFACELGKGVKLKAGHYWLSIVASCSYEGGCGQWAWQMNSTIHNDPALWENPGGGFGYCSSWDTIEDCQGYSGDLMFDLQGAVKRK